MPTQVQHYRAQYRKQQERISKLKTGAELDAIAIALEWPRQDESTTLLEEVKEAACNGVLLAEAKSELHQLKVDLKSARAEVERLTKIQSRHESELNAQQVSHAAKVERLTDERDESFEQVHMLRAACERKEGGA
tara:strand:+ start:303 stop:707 length:405 start_codon:yes stop_codon:yes gene_type:complete